MSHPHPHTHTHTHHHHTIDPDETLSETEAHEHHAHVTPFWPMLWVFVVLLVLTALTVWTSNIHGFWIGNTHIEFGATPHIIMALIIATVKAVLVAAYFMHLKYDRPMNTVVVGATIFGVVLFIGLTLADMHARSINDSVDMRKIVQGGDTHLGADGQRVRGMGVVARAEENARLKHANNPAHAGDAHTGADGAHSDAPAEKPAEPAKSAPGGH
ncbi:MAG TPA: hypothetical protein DEB06_02540 [Phycisphaerales bacterium]|nr:hypothetical protein [Phycisphaerales bacterium]